MTSPHVHPCRPPLCVSTTSVLSRVILSPCMLNQLHVYMRSTKSTTLTCYACAAQDRAIAPKHIQVPVQINSVQTQSFRFDRQRTVQCTDTRMRVLSVSCRLFFNISKEGRARVGASADNKMHKRSREVHRKDFSCTMPFALIARQEFHILMLDT